MLYTWIPKTYDVTYNKNPHLKLNHQNAKSSKEPSREAQRKSRTQPIERGLPAAHVRSFSEIEKRKDLPTRKAEAGGDVWRAFDREKEHETKEEEDEWRREKEGKDQKRDNRNPETWQRNLERLPEKLR